MSDRTSHKMYREYMTSAMNANFAVYSIPEAAALWCGVGKHDLDRIVQECSQLSLQGPGRGVYIHPYIDCIEFRSRAISQAMDKHVLPYGRQDGKSISHETILPYERRYVTTTNLKLWLRSAMPRERPAFLVEPLERIPVVNVSLTEYHLAQHEIEELKRIIMSLQNENKKIKEQNQYLAEECEQFKTGKTEYKPPSRRAEATHQRIIAALLSYIRGELPSVVMHPSFENETKLIALLARHYAGYDGLSVSNLSRKFPEAKRTLELD